MTRPLPTHIEIEGGSLDGKRVPVTLTRKQRAVWRAGHHIPAPSFKLPADEARALAADLVRFRWLAIVEVDLGDGPV